MKKTPELIDDSDVHHAQLLTYDQTRMLFPQDSNGIRVFGNTWHGDQLYNGRKLIFSAELIRPVLHSLDS